VVSRTAVVYVPPNNSSFQEVKDLLRQHNALEKIKEILSPFQFPEQLNIETTECGAVNSYYQRKNLKPTVTLCYEFLKHTLELLPNETSPVGLTRPDAAVGQFFWVTFHEVGHAAFDMFNVPTSLPPFDCSLIRRGPFNHHRFWRRHRGMSVVNP
jgi:putative metallopeptidase DUF4344